MTSKVNLLGMTEARMRDYVQSLGEKPFRAKQLLKWVHQFGVDDFSSMTDLSKKFRARLEAEAEVRAPEIVSQEDSVDGTRKWILRVSGGSCVETVYIPEKGRGTLCVSSQVGCSLDCSFCSTGKQGFQRDLTAAEVIGQVWLAVKSFDGFRSTHKSQNSEANAASAAGQHMGSESKTAAQALTQKQPSADTADGVGRVSNVVMMGMGEPLLNFDNVVDAMNLMMDDLAYGLSKRRVTLSTSGVVPMLDKLGEVSDCSLAISLHAPNDALRNA